MPETASNLAGTLLGLVSRRRPAPPSWEDMAGMEPRLAELLATVRLYQGKTWPTFCRNRIWNGIPTGPGLGERLARLVGPSSGQTGTLATQEALDVATRHLRNALPACEAGPLCSCTRVQDEASA